CTLTTVVVALIGVPAFAASPSPATAPALPIDAVAASSPASVGASAVPAPGMVSKTDDAGLSPGSLAQKTGGAGSTTQLPQATPSTTSSGAQSGTAPGTTASEQAGAADYDDGIIRYEHAKNSEINGPPIGSLQDFMSEGDITSPLGIEVREDKRRLKSGG